MPPESETVYHIYAKNTCLFHNLNPKDFEIKWAMLNNMVGLMKTDYVAEDLSYIKLPSEVNARGSVSWKEPAGDDSY